MKNLFVLFVLFLALIGNLLQAQVRLNLDPASSCNYDGSPCEDVAVYGFDSSREAEETVQSILRQMGLEKNFIIKAANVANAQAHVSKGERYILYSQQFMDAIYNRTGDYWSKIAILAHEIGHHLNGHTLKDSGSRPTLELQADKFSGFVLYKLGASLQQASSAIVALASDRGSATHPPKSARLEAIAVGYNEARELSGGTQPEPEVNRTTERKPDLNNNKVNRPIEKEPTLMDNVVLYDGEAYPTKQFAGKTWLTRNLNINVPDSWCYDDDPKNCRTFGRLYTWEAAKRACASLGSGWRLPTDEEWRALKSSYRDAGRNKWIGDPKKAYQALLKGGSSGFSALLGGWSSIGFSNLGITGAYWSATRYGRDDVWYFSFDLVSGEMSRGYDDKTMGFSCRCVKD